MFGLVDCNNFFASCEMVFNPALSKKALVVLSNNDGCIIARSSKAKEMGIKMGEAAYLYKNRTDIVMLSANFALYSDMSQRVMQTLSQFSPEIEIYSIDEAFFHPPEDCTIIRQTIKDWTGIPVSIGVSQTKTLAKLASEIAKKGTGIFILKPQDLPDLLAKTALHDIWGIGKALSEKLKKEGIYTALELTKKNDTWIQKTFGITTLRTTLELRGIPCFEMTETPEKKKSIVSSRSFGKQITTLPDLHEAISYFVSVAAEKLRKQTSLCAFITVFITNQIETRSCHIHLPNATDVTPTLISLAKQGVKQMFEEGAIYRRGGVMLSEFTETEQLDYITTAPKINQGAMKVLDAINARYDKAALRFAAEGVQQNWKSKKATMSSKFTTNWNELPIAK